MMMRLMNKCLRRTQGRDNKGFTLLELLIVIGIVAIIGTVVYVFFANITKKSTAERTASQVQQKARLAVEIIARDIRMMGLDPTGRIGTSFFTEDNCSHGFSTGAGNDHIFINADLDYDGQLNTAFEQIGYWYDSTNNRIMITFWDDDGGTPKWFCEPLVDNVTSFRLEYKNANGNTISPSADGSGIFFVTVNITIREKKAGEGSNVDEAFTERTYSETVRIRNPQ